MADDGSDIPKLTNAPLLDTDGSGAPVLRRGLFRLLVLQSLAFFLNFAAFNAAQSLDGSIPAPAGLAPIQFMAIYVTFAILCIPAPKLLSVIGPKGCMVLGMTPYAALVASFLAPPVCADDAAGTGVCWSAGAIWALRLTTAVLLGVGAPILWTGQGVYLGRLAAHEARRVACCGVNDEGADDGTAQMLKRYNGVFWTAFQLSGATGLVSSSLVLTLVQSSSAATYLFIGLSACCGVGLVVVVFCLPALPPVASALADERAGEGGLAGGLAAEAEAGAEQQVTVLSTLYLCASPRMLLLVPNIVYNGLSLGFVWYMYNTFVFGSGLGTSFVGFGGALGYLANALATSGMSRVASRCGQLPTMALATLAHAVLWAFLLWYRVKPIQCAGCAHGTAGSCLSGASASDGCVPYSAAGGQQCAPGLKQCEWLHGDAVAPAGGDVALLLAGMCVFHLGDAVWESQVPAVLQTIFDQASGHQPAAMANLKLWQSLGIGVMFGLAQLNDLRLCCEILLGALLLGSLALLWAHTRVANLDSGAPRRRLDRILPVE